MSDCNPHVMRSLFAPSYRQEFIGRGELAERQQRMGQTLHRLRVLAEQFNLAVLLTNQVMADPGAGAALVADAKKPVGGHILAHASDTRVYLRKAKADQRIARIVDSYTLRARQTPPCTSPRPCLRVPCTRLMAAGRNALHDAAQ